MKKLVLYISLAILAVSCEINQKDINPTDEFVKIYNHPDEAEAYYAISIFQVSDGYLILTGLKKKGDDFPKAIIIKTNNLGEIINTYPTNWVAPAPKIVQLGSQIGFVAMDNQYGGHFITINSVTGEEIGSTALPEIYRPLSVNVINNNLVVLGYSFSRESIISLYGSDLSNINTSYFGTGNEYLTQIDNHLMKSGYEFPFFIGGYSSENGKGFFVNCIISATLRINFFHEDGSSTGGYIWAHQAIFSAPSSFIHKEGNMFALTRYNNGLNYISPSVQVDVNGIQHFNDSTKNPLFILPEKAKITANTVSFDGTEFMTFTSVSNANSIMVSQYTLDNDNVFHTVEIPFNDRLEVVDVIQDTEDEGLVVLARTFITGRYVRPMVVKIPKRHFKLD